MSHALPTLAADAVSVSRASDSIEKLSLYDGSVEKAAAPVTGTQRSVFDDELFAKHFIPPDNYEGKHRFDPDATWTPQEENRLVRRIDLRIALFACVCFCALGLDRGNLSNALSDDFLADLKMTTDDYNTGNTIFFVSFLLMEIPSQLVSKRIGADRWIPVQMILWSIVATSQCKLTGKRTFWATRSLLGLLEGGFIPDMVLYLSYFYKGVELPLRLSWFWGSSVFINIVGALLAAAILKLRGTHGWGGWQWLFMIEGLVTLGIGIFAFFYMPASPTQTAGLFRQQSWFSEREETILVTRVLRDDPTKSEMHNRQSITWNKFWRSLTDYDVAPLYILGLMVFIPASTVKAYFTLNMKQLGFSTFNTNLLTIPGSFLSIFTLLGLAWLAKYTNQRAIVSSFQAIWQFPFYVVLLTIPDSTKAWTKYALFVLIVMCPDCQAIIVGWTSQNSGSVRLRSVSASIYNMMCQLGSLISSNIYRTDDKPYYHRGNRVLLGLNVCNIVLFYLAKLYYVKRNQYREQKWNAMTIEEKTHYLNTTTDKGNKRLDFRFVH